MSAPSGNPEPWRWEGGQQRERRELPEPGLRHGGLRAERLGRQRQEPSNKAKSAGGVVVVYSNSINGILQGLGRSIPIIFLRSGLTSEPLLAPLL